MADLAAMRARLDKIDVCRHLLPPECQGCICELLTHARLLLAEREKAGLPAEVHIDAAHDRGLDEGYARGLEAARRALEERRDFKRKHMQDNFTIQEEVWDLNEAIEVVQEKLDAARAGNPGAAPVVEEEP